MPINRWELFIWHFTWDVRFTEWQVGHCSGWGWGNCEGMWFTNKIKPGAMWGLYSSFCTSSISSTYSPTLTAMDTSAGIIKFQDSIQFQLPAPMTIRLAGLFYSWPLMGLDPPSMDLGNSSFIEMTSPGSNLSSSSTSGPNARSRTKSRNRELLHSVWKHPELLIVFLSEELESQRGTSLVKKLRQAFMLPKYGTIFRGFCPQEF